MSDTNTASLPDDFAAYEAARNTPPAAAEKAEPSEAAEEAVESVEESEPSEKEQEEAKEDAELETPKGLKKRFSKLTKTIRELEAKLRAAPEVKPAAATPEPVAENAGKPVAINFDSYEEFVEKLTDWKLEQKELARSKAETDRKQAEKRSALGEVWKARQEAAREIHADYDEVLEAGDEVLANVEISAGTKAAIGETILASEHGAELVYFLGQNTAEAKRIAQLSPLAAAAALGRIEASLISTPEPKPKTTSAPKPPTPVGAKGAPPTKSVYDDKLASDYEAWERTRNAQLSRR